MRFISFITADANVLQSFILLIDVFANLAAFDPWESIGSFCPASRPETLAGAQGEGMLVYE